MQTDYYKKIIELSPVEYYTFEDSNTYFYYNENDSTVSGSAFSEIDNNDSLSPVLTRILQNPKEVQFFGKSVTTNEKVNSSILIGNTNERIYNIYYNNNRSSTRQLKNSNVSFQFSVPTQGNPSMVKLDDYTQIEVYDGNIFLGSALYDGNTFTFYDNRPLSEGDSRQYNVRYSDENNVQHDSFDVQCVQSTSLTAYEDIVIGDYPTEVSSGQQIQIVNLFYEINGIKFAVDRNIGDIRDNVSVLINGYYKKPLNVSSVTIATPIIGQYSTLLEIDLFSCGVYTHLNGSLYFYVRHLSSERMMLIEYDRNYNISINQVIQGNIANYYIFVNGKQNGSVFSVSGVNPITKSFSNYSNLSVGQRFKLTNVNNQNYVLGTRLIAYVDNISVFDKVLTVQDIVKLHTTTLEYFDVIKFNDPTHNFVIDDVSVSYQSSVSDVKLLVRNSNNDQSQYKSLYNGQIRNKFNSVYEYGVSFKETQLYSSQRLVNMSGDFTIIIWLKTSSLTSTIFSQTDYAKPYYGLSILIENGKIVYWSGGIKYPTNMIVSDNQPRMLCVVKSGSLVRTYSPNYHNSTNTITTIQQNNSSHTNLLHEPHNSYDSTVCVSALTIFNKALDLFDIDNLFTTNIRFVVDGNILLRNVPVIGNVRIIDHFTGELLAVVETDSNGYFYWSDSYKRSVDLFAYHEGRYQMVGQITSQTR